MSDAIPGFKGELYYKTGGVDAGGAWVLQENIQDAGLNMEASEGDATTRAAAGMGQDEPLTIRAPIEFEMVVDTGDVDYLAYRAAFLTRAKLGVRWFDEAGGVGVEADMKVFKFNHSQPIDGLQTVSVAIKPCRGVAVREVAYPS